MSPSVQIADAGVNGPVWLVTCQIALRERLADDRNPNQEELF